MLYQSIAYRIEPEDVDDLIQYDGSVILERIKGEIAARCDKEEANSSRSIWPTRSLRESEMSTTRAGFTLNRFRR
jgi:hypothetical protein